MTSATSASSCVVDGQGIPLGKFLASASPAEVTLLDPTLDTIAGPRIGPGRPRKKPERVLDDQACDADPRRQRLAKRGIELVCPHRRHRVKAPCRTVASCGAIGAGGTSNAPSRGWAISAACSYAGK